MHLENGAARPSARDLALVGAAIAALCDVLLVFWLWPQSGPARAAYVLIAMEVGFWGLAGLLGIGLSAQTGSSAWSLLTWAGIGGLAAATFHSALSIIYLTLPVILLFALGAVKVGRRAMAPMVLGLILLGGVAVALSVIG